MSLTISCSAGLASSGTARLLRVPQPQELGGAGLPALSGDLRPRAQLAELLFAEADDPARALRWNLSELRRGLGDAATLEGDPPVCACPAGTEVDVDVVARGAGRRPSRWTVWARTCSAGMSSADAAAFETWCWPSSATWPPPPRRSCTRRRWARCREALADAAGVCRPRGRR